MQSAARILLQKPVVTAIRDPESMALIRSHAKALKSMFATQLGYTLTVESSFARLSKAPLELSAPPRPLVRRNGGRLGASSYAVLALAGAALMAPGFGDQILVSALVTQIRTDAADRSITLSDNISDRRRIVAALGVLIEWGVLVETDGSVTDWAEGTEGEALLTICRPLLPHLLTRALGPHATVNDVVSPRTEHPRRRLRRRLAEDPVVLREDLSPDEVDILSRDRTELTRQLDEHFGLSLEVRAEGALAYDAQGRLTDVEFPGSGSVKQAALLLIGELLDRRACISEDTGFFMPWSIVDAVLADLTNRHKKAWKTEYVESTKSLRTDVVSLIVSLALAQTREHGLWLHHAAARYRPFVTVRATP